MIKPTWNSLRFVPCEYVQYHDPHIRRARPDEKLIDQATAPHIVEWLVCKGV
jgi:hypothetical protein